MNIYPRIKPKDGIIKPLPQCLVCANTPREKVTIEVSTQRHEDVRLHCCPYHTDWEILDAFARKHPLLTGNCMEVL